MEPEYADEWYVITSDDTGLLLSVDFTCPKCGEFVSMATFTKGSDAVYTVTEEGEFELDVACEECGETVTILCDDGNYRREEE